MTTRNFCIFFVLCFSLWWKVLHLLLLHWNTPVNLCGIFICRSAYKFYFLFYFFLSFVEHFCLFFIYLFFFLSSHFISEVRIYLHNDFLRQRMPEIILCHFMAAAFAVILPQIVAAMRQQPSLPPRKGGVIGCWQSWQIVIVVGAKISMFCQGSPMCWHFY